MVHKNLQFFARGLRVMGVMSCCVLVNFCELITNSYNQLTHQCHQTPFMGSDGIVQNPALCHQGGDTPFRGYPLDGSWDGWHREGRYWTQLFACSFLRATFCALEGA